MTNWNYQYYGCKVCKKITGINRWWESEWSLAIENETTDGLIEGLCIINNQNNSITIINFDEISNMDLQTLRLFFILGCISVAYGCLVPMANKFKKEVDHSKITAA